MKALFITESTKTTPHASVNYRSGKIELSGRSSPENTMEFYDPFIKAIVLMSRLKRPKIEANFKMVYFNTSSARCIYLVVKVLKKLQDCGKQISINWYADEDDEDMIETGMDFQDIIGIKFNFRSTEIAD
ncbi:DUF1987 domain-containing protein [Ekhidna sp. To15]|uniref:DUF1987 domain-containing protein n=1 Tax=Ekhidna sp. To15 TaxID=3395267 RepID=UPI003F523987